MKKANTLLLAAMVLTASMALTSCGVTKKIMGVSEVEVPLTFQINNVPTIYKDLDKTVNVTVTSAVTSENDMYDDTNLTSFIRKSLPHYTFSPTVQNFAQEATVSYMQQMRFDISSTADYRLLVNVTTFKMEWVDRSHVECDVRLTYRMVNAAGESILPTASASSHVTLANSEQFGAGLGRAYIEALKHINWDRIADCLRTADTPAAEANAEVTGAGDTALEHTVIRWYILSAPQGADISWRVISSTPDVANTNANFVGTTPYESTESFDIKGLTYNNSGNVQIEVTCERSGYLPQRKRFNLRQAIDQKEISAKFNLVKED